MLRIFALLIACIVGVNSHAESNDHAINALKTSPSLYKLFTAYPSYIDPLTDYATRQGFSRPVENLATIIHEIIHIDSFVHQGFFIDGTYYEPYLKQSAWPALTNEQVRPHVQAHEQGVIYKLYAANTPKNTLANVTDEINAYTHVLPFICINEPASAAKQIKNLTGFLHLSEAHLRTLRTQDPRQYLQFSGSKQARGVFTLVIQRALNALQTCPQKDIRLDLNPISQEANHFFRQPK